MDATGSKVVGVEEDGDRRNECEMCPGIRMPPTHRSSQVEGRFGKGTPHSSLHMRFERESVDTIALAKEPLVTLAFVFKCDS